MCFVLEFVFFYLNLYFYFFLFVHTVNYKSSDQIASARSDLGDCAVSADWRGRSHLACHICIEIKENSYFLSQVLFCIRICICTSLYLCTLSTIGGGTLFSFVFRDYDYGTISLASMFLLLFVFGLFKKRMWNSENVEN